MNEQRRPKELSIVLLMLLACLSGAPVGCDSDDDSSMDGGGGAGGSSDAARDGGSSGSKPDAASGSQADATTAGQSGGDGDGDGDEDTDPEPDASEWCASELASSEHDPCVTCMLETCCEELGHCRPVSDSEGEFCQETELGCVQECFEREVEGDAGVDSESIAGECSRECELGYYERVLVACVTGGPAPISIDNQDHWREGEPSDDDAGAAPNCALECFPEWR